MNAPPILNPPRTAKTVSIFLSVVLGLFLADAALSLLDDTLILLLGKDPLSFFRGTLFLGAALAALLAYLLLGFSPMVPKRFFLPVTLFNPVMAQVRSTILFEILIRGWAALVSTS